MPAMSSKLKYDNEAPPVPENRSDSFAIIPVYGNKAPSNALMHGSLTSLISHMVDNRTMSEDRALMRGLRADAAELAEQTKQLQNGMRDAEQTEAKLADFARQVNAMVDALTARMDSIEEALRGASPPARNRGTRRRRIRNQPPSRAIPQQSRRGHPVWHEVQ